MSLPNYERYSPCPQQLTWSKVVECAIKIVFVDISQNWWLLRTHLTISTEDYDQEAAFLVISRFVVHIVEQHYRVYEVPILLVCHRDASSSEQSPRIEALIVAAADRPPDTARCIPLEKNGSINAGKGLKISYHASRVVRTSCIPNDTVIRTGIIRGWVAVVAGRHDCRLWAIFD